MFSKPEYGWTNITLGEFIGRGSYLTDIPIDCLNAFINGLKNGLPASVFFDEEGSEFTIVSNHFNTHIIIEREKFEVIEIAINITALAKEIVKDVETYFYEWENWLCYDDKDEQREQELKEKLNELKILIEARSKIQL